jgi:hypothetical protein
MHSTITTVIVALTVRVVFAFVCMCAVALGFAFSFAARQCSCMLRCLNFGLPGGVGEEETELSLAGAECFPFFSDAQGNATAVQKLDLDFTEAGKFGTRSLPFISGKATATDVLNSL